MGKETKVGLFVIMLLLLLFGVVVVQKVRSSPSPTASQGAQDESELAGDEAGSTDSDGSLVGLSEDPTILEPDAFTQGTHPGVSPVYTDNSGSQSVNMEIPSAADIGLAPEGSHPDPLMPNPAASLDHEAYDMSHGPSYGGDAELAQFEEPETLDQFADESLESEPYRQPPLAAIGGDSGQPSVEAEDDPFGMLEEDSPEEFADDTGPSGYSAPDDFGEETDPSWDEESLTGIEYEDPDLASNTRGDDAGRYSSVPSYDEMSSVEEEYADGLPFGSTGGRDLEDDGDSLLMPDVPPAIEDFDAPQSRTPLRVGGSTYVVQSNDSFWAISQKRYGTGRYFKALHLHNRTTVPEPEKLRPGMVIATPPASVLEATYAQSISKPASGAVARGSTVPGGAAGPYRETTGKKWYRVGNQDTLYDIAKATLGRGSQWRVIYELNRDRLENPDRLKPGMVLRLPDSAEISRMATMPLVPLR